MSGKIPKDPICLKRKTQYPLRSIKLEFEMCSGTDLGRKWEQGAEFCTDSR